MPLHSSFRDASRQSIVEEVLRRSGSVQMRVFGQSMLPTIWPGDVVRIERCPASQVAIGDIALFRRGEQFLVHRIRRIFADSLQLETQGDSACDPDPLFHESELLGKVTTVQRHSRTQPVRGLGAACRMMGRVFCHCDHLRNLALRLNANLKRPRGCQSKAEGQASTLVAVG